MENAGRDFHDMSNLVIKRTSTHIVRPADGDGLIFTSAVFLIAKLFCLTMCVSEEYPSHT
jgi:hypothetical protein